MATLQKKNIAPFARVSHKALPEGLRSALHFIFERAGDNVWFVGGSALAGYYAEHRRSDDLDLFSRDAHAQLQCVRAVQSLRERGASLSRESTTPHFFRADVQFLQHTFTIAVVLDENLHRVGAAVRTEDGVMVADIKTLLMMKLACLVSRCSEKDLFDLHWIFEQSSMPKVQDIITLGSHIDGGVNTESVLMSLAGASLKKDACHFLLPHSSLSVEHVFRRVKGLQKKLLRMFLDYQKQAPLSPAARALQENAHDFKKR